MSFTMIQAETTVTAANAGAATALDISGATFAAFRHLKVRIRELKATSGSGPKKATLQIQYVTAADFTTPVDGPAFNVQAELLVTQQSEIMLSVAKRDIPSLPVGVANGKVRVILASIDANSSITYSAWLEGV